MRVLNCLLIREGPSDEWFLAPLLQRALDCLVCEKFDGVVEILPIRSLRADHQRPEDVLAAAERANGVFDVLLYHHDGAPTRHSADVVGRMRTAWQVRNGPEPLVPVVPVRETEAWVLADREALAGTLSIRTATVEKAVPAKAADVEALIDPKQILRSLVRPAVGMRARRRHHELYEGFFDRLATRVSIERLREFPSFAAWWDEMTQALEGLGYRHG